MSTLAAVKQNMTYTLDKLTDHFLGTVTVRLSKSEWEKTVYLPIGRRYRFKRRVN